MKYRNSTNNIKCILPNARPNTTLQMFVNDLNKTNMAKPKTRKSSSDEFSTLILILPMEDKWNGANVTCCYLSPNFGKDCKSRSPIKGMLTALTSSD